MKIETVLVPTDFSGHAERAVEVAMELAGTFGARIRLLHAYHLPVGVVGPYDYTFPAEAVTAMREAGSKRLEKEAERVSQAGIPVEATLTEGSAHAAILEAAEQFHADLIVMGTRGLTGLKHAVLGSVAERTLREAPCPVLTVPGPDEDD